MGSFPRPGSVSRLLIWVMGFSGAAVIWQGSILAHVVFWISTLLYVFRPLRWDGVSHRHATVKLNRTKGIGMTLSMNYKEDGVTLEENFDGRRMHADFIDDVYPDRTCGQYDRGIWVRGSEGREFFVSFTDGSVWDGDYKLDARCPEICVIAALSDAREPFYPELDEDTYRVVTS